MRGGRATRKMAFRDLSHTYKQHSLATRLKLIGYASPGDLGAVCICSQRPVVGCTSYSLPSASFDTINIPEGVQATARGSIGTDSGRVLSSATQKTDENRQPISASECGVRERDAYHMPSTLPPHATGPAEARLCLTPRFFAAQT
jgi:hypothetical protein